MSRGGYEWARNLTGQDLGAPTLRTNGTCTLATRVTHALTALPQEPQEPFIATVEVPEDRYKSKTERRFAQLLDVWQYQRSIKRWWYEPMEGIYLAPSTTYSPDFLIEPSTTNPPVELRPFLDHAYRLIVVETKGEHVWKHDWIKAKTAAALYPCFRFVRAQWKRHEWHWKLIPPA